jgi:hypothetical protein
MTQHYHESTFGEQPYSEMMMQYTEFKVFAPGARGTTFTGKRGEREAYETLIGVPEARIADAVIRVDLLRIIRALVRGHYTNRRPERGVPHTYGGELDGKRIYIEFYLSRGRLIAHAHEGKEEKGTEVEMEIVHNLDDATILDAVGPSRHASIADDMGALRLAAPVASGSRVVFVTAMRVWPLRWSEWPLRMMHAAVALSAQLGLITGGSLVAIDKLGYGLSLRPFPRMLEKGLSKLQCYQLEPIGRHILVCRADEIVSRLRNFDAYGYTRASQIGMRNTKERNFHKEI